MTVTQRQVDSWLATVTGRIDRIQAAVLDLVDVGLDEPLPAARMPSNREKAATYRPGDTGDLAHYQPTPAAQGRRSSMANPTLGRLEARETEIERAVTWLHDLADRTVNMLTLEDLELDKHPPPLPTRVTGSGERLVSCGPARVRAHVVEMCGWLREAAGAFAEPIRSTRPGEAMMLRSRAAYLEQLTASVARRLGTGERSTCDAGCGRPATGTCGACRVRKHRNAS